MSITRKLIDLLEKDQSQTPKELQELRRKIDQIVESGKK